MVGFQKNSNPAGINYQVREASSLRGTFRESDIGTRSQTTMKMNKRPSSPMLPAMVYPCPILTRRSELAKMARLAPTLYEM